MTPILLLSGCPSDYTLPECPAEVVVNEVLASSHDRQFEGATVDWVELFNAGDATADLEGWTLSRTPEEAEFVFSEGDAIDAGGFLLVITDTFDVGSARPWTGFDLNRDGDALFLDGPGRASCDEVVYPDQHADFSWQREADGEDAWCRASDVSPEATNNDTPCMCDDSGGSPWC